MIGHWPFRGLDLEVDERVLIPRPETEELVTHALAALASTPVAAPLVVDLGCGSGAIGLSVVTELAARGVTSALVGVDRSSDALEVARANALKHSVLSASFVRSSWFDDLDPSLRARVDLVAANPPYVAADELPRSTRCSPTSRGAHSCPATPTASPVSPTSPGCSTARGSGSRAAVTSSSSTVRRRERPRRREREPAATSTWSTTSTSPGGPGPGRAAPVTRLSFDEAVGALRSGAIVALPTDTVYGVGAGLEFPEAVEGLFALKRRSAAVALPVVAADADAVARLVERWPRAAARAAAEFWPGALTIVVEARGPLGALVHSASSRVGFRVPGDELLAAVLAATGPLALTSANEHGSAPCVTADDVLVAFAGRDELRRGARRRTARLAGLHGRGVRRRRMARRARGGGVGLAAVRRAGLIGVRAIARPRG